MSPSHVRSEAKEEGGCRIANIAHLHGNLAVVDEHFASQEIGTDGGLVAGAELLVDLDGRRNVSRPTDGMRHAHPRSERVPDVHIDSSNSSCRHRYHRG